MRKRFNHTTSVEQYRIRNRFSHKTNITALTETSLDVNEQGSPNDVCMDFHEYDDINFENCQDDDKSFDNEDEYNDENEDNDYDNGEEDNNDENNNYENEDDHYYDNDDYYYDEESDNYYNDEDDDRNDHNDRNVDRDENNESNDDECLEDPIVDAPMDRDQMPNTNGNFAPYFENTTCALLFCWMQKHNICKLNKYNIRIMNIY
jgi:hypothetical protein